ncbi:MAG: 4Fe-4S binding protein [Armatimonadota bacterium]
MSVRNIVKIDEEKCNGCGQCVTACAEGALKIIDGKARLVSDIYCDGLGACLGHCPRDAISVIKRDAKEFDEKAVGEHLEKEKKVKEGEEKEKLPCGCPGTMAREIKKTNTENSVGVSCAPSELTNWPVQLKLISPQASYFKERDIVIAADCTAFSYGAFHSEFLRDKALIIACPKLDDAAELYVDKLSELFKEANPRSVAVVRMEVPCCSGLSKIVDLAKEKSGVNIPVKEVIIGVGGEIKS